MCVLRAYWVDYDAPMTVMMMAMIRSMMVMIVIMIVMMRMVIKPSLEAILDSFGLESMTIIVHLIKW